MYDIGDVVPLAVAITDANGDPADAGAVTVTVTDPTGVPSTPAVVHGGTGEYTSSVTPTVAGRWEVAWIATGVNACAHRDVFNVADATVMPVVSLAEAKEHLNITSSTHDDELRRLLSVVSDMGERTTGRVFGRRTITEDHDGGTTSIALHRMPVVSVGSVTESGAVCTEWTFRPATGILVRTDGGYSVGVWDYGHDTVRVTYTAGYAVQPASDVQGALELLRHLWTTQRGSMPAMPRSLDGDSYQPGLGYTLPTRVRELWGAATVPGMA